VAKLRPAGRIRRVDQFNPARQMPCIFFSDTTFPTVDNSATALATACLPQQDLAASSAIEV